MAPVTPVIEREYRFRRAARLPREALAGPTWRDYTVIPLPTERQLNTYYDTPSRALARQGITFRRRLVADHCEITLKLAKQVAAAHLIARPEYTAAVAPGAPLVGQPLLGLAQRFACGEMIDRWFTACTLREGVSLRRGATVIHLTWDTVTLPDDPDYIDREIEIELVAGSLADLTALAQVLVDEVGLVFGRRGKRSRTAAHLRRLGLLTESTVPEAAVA